MMRENYDTTSTVQYECSSDYYWQLLTADTVLARLPITTQFDFIHSVYIEYQWVLDLNKMRQLYWFACP